MALYVSESLNVKVVTTSLFKNKLPLSMQFITDYLFIELILPNKKVLVGVFYKPPGVKDYDVLDNVLNRLVPQYDDVVIMGDFNEDLNVSSKLSKLNSLFSPLFLKIVKYQVL